MKTKKIKIETVVIVPCKIFNKKHNLIGKGYTLIRANGMAEQGFYMSNKGKVLNEGWYDFRHSDDRILAIANWTTQ